MESKELLLKDTFSRLGTNTKYQIKGEENLEPLIIGGHIKINDDYFFNFIISENHRLDFKDISEIKPYLFPISSMTEEQEKEYNSLNGYELGCFPHTEDALDYLIANHFDYRELIPMGSALDATDLNIY